MKELQNVLAGVLPEISGAGFRMAAQSALNLGAGRALPSNWLALRSARFTWRCRLARNADKIWVLFIPIETISAREQMDANVTFEVQPVTLAEANRDTDVIWPGKIAVPASYVRRPDAALEFRFEGRTFLISLNTLEIKLTDPEAPAHIQLESAPLGQWEGAGTKVRWTLDAFVTFAFSFARASANRPAQVVPLAPPLLQKFPPGTPTLRDLLMELATAFTTAPGLVAKGDSAPGRKYLPLEMYWRLAAAGAQLNVLVNPSGFVAAPKDEDTFLVPCRLDLAVTQGKWTLFPSLDWPDFLLRGTLRDAALAAFIDQAGWEEAAETPALASLGCTANLLKDWADDEARTLLLRVDRRPHDDEVLLMLKGQLQGTDVVVLFHANHVKFTIDSSGHATVKTMSGVTLVQAALRDGTLMTWDTELGGGKQIFCDLLHGFLRWHALVRSELAP